MQFANSTPGIVVVSTFTDQVTAGDYSPTFLYGGNYYNMPVESVGPSGSVGFWLDPGVEGTQTGRYLLSAQSWNELEANNNRIRVPWGMVYADTDHPTNFLTVIRGRTG